MIRFSRREWRDLFDERRNTHPVGRRDPVSVEVSGVDLLNELRVVLGGEMGWEGGTRIC